MTPENVAACCPNKDGISAMIDDEAAKMLAIVRQQMNNAKLFFACDGTNKKGLHHVVKVVSWWCGDGVMNEFLDSDAATGDNVNAAQAIDISLRKIDDLNLDMPEKSWMA